MQVGGSWHAKNGSHCRDRSAVCAILRPPGNNAFEFANFRITIADCSVVGFDDIPGSEFYNPRLTTVQQQLEMQGSLGAEIVEELILASLEKRPAQAKYRKVSPKLIVRESTCPATYSEGRNRRGNA